MNDPEGFGLGARHIAISTAGWVPGIERLAEEPLQLKLALSLHAPNDELRTQLMPVTQAVSDRAADGGLPRLPRAAPGGAIFVEYLLLDGVNDDRRAGRASWRRCCVGREGFHVNLIAYNPTGVRVPRLAARARARRSPRRSAGGGVSRQLPPLARPATSTPPAASWPCGAPASAARRRLRPSGRTRSSGHDAETADQTSDVPGSRDDAAWVIRPERLGDPSDAMQLEQIEVPDPGPGEVLVRVMAAGVNYNGVWASLGLPVSIFRYTGYDFHIAGSDASGVVERGRPGRDSLEARRRGRRSTATRAAASARSATASTRWPAATRRSGPTRRTGAASPSTARVQAQQLLPKPAAADLGGGGVATGSPTSPPTGCSSTRRGMRGRRQRARVGRRRRAGHRSPCSSARCYGANADRRRLVGRQGRPRAASWARRRSSTGASSCSTIPTRGERDLDEIKRFGKAIREATGGVRLRHRVRARRHRDVLHVSVFVCQHVRQDRDLRRDLGLQRSTSTCATCGCGRSDHRQPLRQRLRVPTAPTS